MATATDAETQEAFQQWGYLLRPNNTPTDKLDRLLRGIAACITSSFGQTDNNDLAPAQLAAFYKTVGGDYDQLFLNMLPQSIGFIYKSLGCLHSVQPANFDPHVAPSVPCLKPKGFVTWQTIQLLLGPQQHVPFLQQALRVFEVRDPEDGNLFPKVLPAASFPTRPDPEMEKWHSEVSERLRLEAERGASLQPSLTPTRSSGELSVDGSVDERADAARYFDNPFNRNREGKPGIIQTITSAPVKMFQGGKAVASTVLNGGKMVADPHLFSGRRRSLPDRTTSMDSGAGGHGRRDSPRPSRHHSRKSPHRRRSHSVSSVDSDVEREPPRRERRYRSNGTPPESPGGYFSRKHDRREESSSSRNHTPRTRKSRSPAYRNTDFHPSRSPPLAARVAQAQHPDYLTPDQRRPSTGQRASSEHRSYYDQRFHPGHKHRRSDVDGYDSEQPRSASHHAPPMPFHQSPQDAYDGRGFPSSRPLERQVSGGRDNVGYNYRQPPPPGAVNGVKGRRYPNETPWQS